MPQDDLFDDSNPNPNSGEPKAGEPQGGAPKLAEQLSALTANLGKLVETQGATNARVEALAQRLTQPPAGDPADDVDEPAYGANGQPSTPQQKKFAKFYENPEQFIKEEAGKLVKEQLAPHLVRQAEQTAKALEGEQRAKIDGIYGDGTWDAEYAADFAATVGKLGVEVRSSRDHVEAGVAAIHGRKDLTPQSRTSLEERRQKVEKARREANAPALLGNGMPRPRNNAAELSQDAVELIDKLNRNGIPYTKERYLAARANGTTESSWRAAKQAAAPKAAPKGAA